MIRFSPRLVAAAALTATAVAGTGCGGADDGAPKVTTTDAGTVIVGTTDDAAGLKVEIQNDSLYLQFAGDHVPAATRILKGTMLGGACDVDGGAGVRVNRGFPIYWRKDSRDWGSSVLRDPSGTSGEPPNLAQH
ncbi:MAG: hypothetical protein QOE11_1176, partial [Solirubrobacteraceae bacterium]|nr:hypothetical protein [Solirubrobacteraceae bacterium]